jgi:hypothetical protein
LVVTFNAANKQGSTPLRTAVFQRHLRIAKPLATEGADAELAAKHADSHNATDLAELIRA